MAMECCVGNPQAINVDIMHNHNYGRNMQYVLCAVDHAQ